MSDLISRQDAIDALNGQISVTGDINAKAVQNYIRMVNQRLHDLPSAEPHKILFGSGIEWSGTSNLPSAEPMPDGFDPEHLTEEDKRDIAEALDYLKDTLEACTESQCESVQEIIRCKDCKKYSEKTHCIMWSDDINEFCSRAERKTDD